MSSVKMVSYEGTRALAVVDFNTGAAEAGTVVTIDGVSYTEADTAVATSGVWTNGASAANSATSFAAAVNGDLRVEKPPVSAFVSTAGDSVFVVADYPGSAYNFALTEDSANNVTVENMHGGTDPARKGVVVVNYVVTAQDVLAAEVNIPVNFTPTAFNVMIRDTDGDLKAYDGAVTIAASPARIKLDQSGSTDLVATDVVHAVIFE